MYGYGGSGGLAVVGVIIAVVVVCVFAGAVAVIARDYHGKSAGKWFFLSLVLSPVLALLFLLAVSERPAQAAATAAPAVTAQAARKPCTRCGKDVRATATSCPHCGATL